MKWTLGFPLSTFHVLLGDPVVIFVFTVTFRESPLQLRYECSTKIGCRRLTISLPNSKQLFQLLYIENNFFLN